MCVLGFFPIGFNTNKIHHIPVYTIKTNAIPIVFYCVLGRDLLVFFCCCFFQAGKHAYEFPSESDYSSQPMCFYDASKKEGIHDLMFRVRAFNVTFYETIKK